MCYDAFSFLTIMQEVWLASTSSTWVFMSGSINLIVEDIVWSWCMKVKHFAKAICYRALTDWWLYTGEYLRSESDLWGEGGFGEYQNPLGLPYQCKRCGMKSAIHTRSGVGQEPFPPLFLPLPSSSSSPMGVLVSSRIMHYKSHDHTTYMTGSHNCEGVSSRRWLWHYGSVNEIRHELSVKYWKWSTYERATVYVYKTWYIV